MLRIAARGAGRPPCAAQTHLPQGLLPGGSVLQAQVQSAQLQPHGRHVEGVQWVVLTGRGGRQRPSEAREPVAAVLGARHAATLPTPRRSAWGVWVG